MIRSRYIFAISALGWATAVGGGLLLVLKYENTAGTAGHTPPRWPAHFQLTYDTKRPTLVMFAHPQCPCTRASIGELARLMTQCQGQLTAHVFVLRPTGFSQDWAQTDLWRSATAIPGVDVRYDDGGVEARRFGAETSGYVVLYDSTGRLIFHGGITGARGHAGDNAGRSAMVALLRHQTVGSSETPVFGCSLQTVDATKCGGSIACNH